ncbi:hypothetical protein JW948_12515 [bacterium]|nr:hypothetical protein [bacterium]
MDANVKKLNCISFDIFRSLGMPDIRVMKPEEIFRKTADLKNADWILFPPYGLLNLMAYAFHKSVFPSLNTYHLGFDKVQMTRSFMVRFPEQTPETLIMPAGDNSLEMILDRMRFPFVAKEVRNARGKGVFLIRERKELQDYINKNETLYIQEYLDIRRDLRVVWVADRVVLAYWRTAPPGGFLNNVAAGGSIDYGDIPEQALQLVGEVCRSLNINYAGFDIAEVNGHFYLLEYNLFFGTQALGEKKIQLGPIIHQYLLEQSRTVTPLKPLLPKAV